MTPGSSIPRFSIASGAALRATVVDLAGPLAEIEFYFPASQEFLTSSHFVAALGDPLVVLQLTERKPRPLGEISIERQLD